MRRAFILPATVLLAAMAPAQAPSRAFVTEPALTPASPAAIAATCDAYLAHATSLRTALETGKGAAGPATLKGYDDLIRVLDDAGNDAGLLAEVAPDEPRRDAARACQGKVSDASDAVSLSRLLYDRLKAIAPAGLDPTGRYVLTRTIAAFDRSGVSRDAAMRARVGKLKAEITALGIQFDANIANGRKTVTADPAELDGLPVDYIAAHKPAADGKIIISTDYPDINPVMSYAKSEALRRRLYEANLTRAWPANDAVLKQLFAKRDKLARLLGRADYASLITEDKMVDTPAKVRAFLASAKAAGDSASRRDYGRILARFQRDQPGATFVPAWSSTYISQLIRKENYALDPQEVRRYFAYDDVRDGILQLTRDLMGVEIRPWATKVWDPSVEAYEMLDGGKVIGRFYFDTHPRPGKYNHANLVPIRYGIRDQVIPVAALVTNFPAGDHKTGLMEHRDVETFLHEYGHLIHALLSGRVDYESASMSNLEWDFIEAPSQMLENFVWDYDTLARFAQDENGKPIPRALVAKMNDARYFGEAYGDLRQLGFANVSLTYHSGAPANDLTATYAAASDPFAYVPMPAGIHPEDSFGHLSGYSAIYYTYMWSKTIATDLFTRFEQDGLRNPATAKAYREMVLMPGGSKPAATLVQDFLGRPLSLDAYKARLARGG
jgi:thimet oligopeptidase